MKVDRQEVIAVYAALREWLTTNHEDRFAAYETRISVLRAELSGVLAIRLSNYPEDGPADGLRLMIDSEKLGKTASDVIGELRNGNPGIWVRQDADEESLIIRMPTLKEGGEHIIAQRLKEILNT